MAKNPAMAVPRKRGRSRKSETAIQAEAVASPEVIAIPDQPVISDETISIDPETGSVEVDHADGSITIDPTGASLRPDTADDQGGEFDENLALKVDPMELGRIANDLLDAIAADKNDRSEWERMRAKAIDQLGLKLEDPKSDVTRSTQGIATSVVKDPTLLEAVERFRANAYAEMCPSSGPVKVVNFSDNKLETDPLATALQKDLNYYLTTTASEYYPDTRYMLWWTGLSSGTFKKVYRCPLRRRPVSEYVDGADLIVPSSATDLKNASRVTHEVKMARDIMRAMQIEGVYRDVTLTDPVTSQANPVAAKIASIAGKAVAPQRVEDQEYTIFECYCKLDLRGYRHEQDGEATGLPLPYRVTIEETSRQILEIRRNWDPEHDDEEEGAYRQPHIPFVLFPYSTGISRIYGCGLGQMLGNMASALTALLRISIDNGMMSNYPGLIKAKGTGRQVQNQISVPPGGIAEFDTGGLPIQSAVMGMPFKDVSQNVVALIEQTRGVAQRLGSTADLPVGEGRQDAPVGTTLAMIEQATKVEGSVHKALHAAQSEEFRLLVRLFKADPEALWRSNRRPAMGTATDDASRAARVEKFKRALANCDIQPTADPNVPSDMHRNLMATGLKQSTQNNPAYDPVKVDRFVFKQMFKMSDDDFNSLLAPPMQAQPNPVLDLESRKVAVLEQRVQVDAAKVDLSARNAEADRALKETVEMTKIAATAAAANVAAGREQPAEPGMSVLDAEKLAIEKRKVDQKDAELAFKNANAQLDRESKETVETLKLAQAIAVHPGSDPLVDEQLDQMDEFLSPAKNNPGNSEGMADGGRVRWPGRQSENVEDRSSDRHHPAALALNQVRVGLGELAKPIPNRPVTMSEISRLLPSDETRVPSFAVRLPPRHVAARAAGGAAPLSADDAIERALALAREIQSDETAFQRFLHS